MEPENPYTTIIKAEELMSLIDGSRVKIIDCRYQLQAPHYGINSYKVGHIPESIYWSISKDLSAPHQQGITGRHPLPDRDDFYQRVRKSGLDPQDQVVVYDQSGGFMASRAWWMLRWIGFKEVAVLDGGYAAWERGSYPVTQFIPHWPSGNWELEPPPPILVRAEDVSRLINKADILDAREYLRYSGEKEPIDPIAGHITGAVCADYTKNLLPEGHFLPSDKLRARFLGLLRGDASDAICYCGSGITATHNILAMEIAGLGMAKLYPGSWSEWITDPSRPISIN